MSDTKQRRIDWGQVKRRLRDSDLALQQASAVDGQRLKDVYRQRAERLAERTDRAAQVRKTAHVVFAMSDEVYGIRLRDVAQVFPDTECTPVPGAAGELVGVANLQGEIRSVLELRTLLGLPASDGETKRYVLLLRHDGLKLGLRVEQVEGVRQVADDSVSAVEDISTPTARFVHGVTCDHLILLRTDAFFECFRDQRP